MRYMLLDYVIEAGWPALSKAEQEHWLGAYRAYMQAMRKAGVLESSGGLKPTPTATTVRIRENRTNVLDGPFAETKEQLGGYYLVEARDREEAVDIAAKIPGARFGSIEVRPITTFS